MRGRNKMAVGGEDARVLSKFESTVINREKQRSASRLQRVLYIKGFLAPAPVPPELHMMGSLITQKNSAAMTSAGGDR